MFPNNPCDPNNPFWQTKQNNEQEDLYCRDPRTGKLGYYPMPLTTPTSSHPTTQPMPPFFGYYSQPPFFHSNIPQDIPETQNPKHNRNQIRSRNPTRILF
ncbi:hypothetical protein Hanom_Chr16g01418691 [Helianthus anomalus]